MSPPAASDRQKGQVLLVTTAVLWSTNGALVKLIHQSGAGPSGWAIAFYRSLFAGIVLTPVALGRLRQASWSVWWIASVVSFTGMTATFIQAERYLLSPIFYLIALGGMWLLRTQAGMGKGVSFAIAFSLAIIVTRIIHTVWGMWSGRFAEPERGPDGAD